MFGRGPAARTQALATPDALVTEEAAKRTAQQNNENGKIASKFGMKILIHNHTGEFAPLEGSKLTLYDVLLRETDPELVAMQLDIGWASIAGQNIIEMFKVHPGRFELWHVKDAYFSLLTPKMSQKERMWYGQIVPVGEGEVDYKTIFANAQLAGLKHYCVEHDEAASWGDAVATAKVSYDGLMRILS